MLCEQIKKARIRKGLMQKTLAELLNVKPSTVSMWESGTRTPDLSIIPKICEILGVDYDYLLGDDLFKVIIDEKIQPAHAKEKAPAISRSDLEAIMKQMDESEIDQMIDYAHYLLSKKAIRFVPEDQSDK